MLLARPARARNAPSSRACLDQLPSAAGPTPHPTRSPHDPSGPLAPLSPHHHAPRSLPGRGLTRVNTVHRCDGQTTVGLRSGQTRDETPTTAPRAGPWAGGARRLPRGEGPAVRGQALQEGQRGQGPGGPGPACLARDAAGEVARRLGLWRLSRPRGQSPGPPASERHSEPSLLATPGCLLAQANPHWLLPG